ncbi:MAG: hypothetical protein M3437_16510 [Chloroflexota bacterium]|nr:hypothetical protein [Chloroflexota bacterium]MDQ5867971.1 hypothetical protein [Chloroflexota bacterium]
MFKRKRFTNLSLALLLAFLLVACGGDTNPTPGAPTATTAASMGETAVATEPVADTEPTEEVETEPEGEATAEGETEPEVEPTTAADTPRGQGIGASGEGSFDTSGTYVADLGFRPDNDGFRFENYGGDIPVTNLTAADLRRMFGDEVCASLQGEDCTLTPAGTQWMEQVNQSMSGGHCEGMAVLSNLFYTKKVNPADFGAASVPELQLDGNERLQREIAYWFTTQATQPARQGIVQQTPSGVLNTLMTAFEAGPEGSETYAVGFYKRDMTGGHAVTPYAVEDRGGGIYWIMIYDNNYPQAARAIEVDTNADTWRYSGSTNPSEPADEYEGDAGSFTLELAAIEPRLTPQFCPFCEAPAGGRTPGLGAQGTTYNEVWLDGDANLLITDMEGNSIGFKDGKFVNEIPGAQSNANKFGVDVWDVKAEPVYYVPTNIDFTISIDGSDLTEPSVSTVTFIGPGYVLEVSDIMLDPGQVDILDIAPDGSLLSYRTTSNESPVMLVGIETEAADYLFAVQGYEMDSGEAINLSLNTEEGWLSLDSIDNTNSALYSLLVARYDDQGEQVFGADDVGLDPDDVVYVDYLKWAGNGQPMELDVDRGGDGTVDESLQVGDITDEMPEEAEGE